MKKGFTLAEVLITLAVIGVVAALTIPVLVQKYQKKQLYSQFMKTYNTITTVLDNAIAEYGETNTWKWGDWKYNSETGEEEFNKGDDPISNYLLSQLKVIKKCDSFSDCFASSYTFLNGEDGSSEQYPDDTLLNSLGDYEDYGAVNVILADGTVMQLIDYGGGDIGFVFDTNGKKGPNVMGRDLFSIEYESDSYKDEAAFDLPEYDPNSSYGNNCSPNNSEGWGGSRGCPSRLLQEGAMNY